LGTVSAPEFGSQPSQGATINYNAAPGSVNAPILFEASDELNHTNSVGSLHSPSAGTSGKEDEVNTGGIITVVNSNIAGVTAASFQISTTGTNSIPGLSYHFTADASIWGG
jgi:hypothetical protein